MARHWQNRLNPFTPIRRDLYSILRKVDIDRFLYSDYTQLYDTIEWRINELLSITDL